MTPMGEVGTSVAAFVHLTVGCEIERALQHAGCSAAPAYPPNEDIARWWIVEVFWWGANGQRVTGDRYTLGPSDAPDSGPYVPDGQLPTAWAPGWTLTIYASEVAFVPPSKDLDAYTTSAWCRGCSWSMTWKAP